MTTTRLRTQFITYLVLYIRISMCPYTENAYQGTVSSRWRESSRRAGGEELNESCLSEVMTMLP